MAFREGRDEEAADLLRNALAALPLMEERDIGMEMGVRGALIDALFKTHAIDEVESVILSYREAATTQAASTGRLCFTQMDSLLYSARFQEVSSSCTLCWEPLNPVRPLNLV